MNPDNKYVVFLIALLMSVSLVGANAAVALDRTALDADHLSDRVADEGVYEELATDARENISEEIDENLDENTDERPAGITFDFDSEAIASQAVTAEFFADEFTRNFEQLIAFMEGDRSELEMWIDLTPLYDSVIEQFTADSITVDTVAVAQTADLQSANADVEITDEMLAELNEDEAGYQSVRADIRSQGVGTVPVEFNASGSPRIETVTLAQESDFTSGSSDIEVTDSMIERLNEDSEGYEQVRGNIRDQVRESLPPRAREQQVDQALQDANEELKADAREQARADYGDDVNEETLQNIIALQNTVIDGLTDPDFDSFAEYERQRDADERTLEASLDGEIDTALQETNEEVKTEAAEQARTEYGDDVGDQTLADIISLQHTVIDGLTDPDLDSFDEYESRRATSEDALEESLAAELRDDIRTQIEENSQERIDLTEGLDEDSGGISTMRSVVSLVGLATVALPVLFVLLVGGLYAATRSVPRTGRATGYALLVAGGIGAILGLVAKGPVISAMEPDTEGADAAEAGFADAFVSIFESLFDTLVTQSVVLAVVGVGLVGVVYAGRAGYFDGIGSESVAETAGSETETDETETDVDDRDADAERN